MYRNSSLAQNSYLILKLREDCAVKIGFAAYTKIFTVYIFTKQNKNILINNLCSLLEIIVSIYIMVWSMSTVNSMIPIFYKYAYKYTIISSDSCVY